MRNKRRVLCFLIVVAFVFTMVPLGLAEETSKVNINKASIEELTKLKGIGQKYAERIVKFREENGPFTAPEDLLKVKGLGEKVLEANKDMITIE